VSACLLSTPLTFKLIISMKITDVYQREDAAQYLYQLLEERAPHVSISHKQMPTFAEHCEFMHGAPYVCWLLILTDVGDVAGAIYLSKRDEIGVALFKSYQGRGIGESAVKELIRLHPRRRFLANVNPANEASAGFFRKLGFKEIQRTYENAADQSQ